MHMPSSEMLFLDPTHWDCSVCRSFTSNNRTNGGVIQPSSLVPFGCPSAIIEHNRGGPHGSSDLQYLPCGDGVLGAVSGMKVIVRWSIRPSLSALNPEKSRRSLMQHRLTMVYWKSEKFWLGKLLEHPEIMTQGETLEELEENLKDAYHMMVWEDVPDDYAMKEIAL
jgi:predicted RNase H-like HicB family nuclease